MESISQERVGMNKTACDEKYVWQEVGQRSGFSGAPLNRIRYADRNAGQRVRLAFKPIHTGSIWVLPSKIVAFLACLVGTTMPLTGTLMWWWRTRKKNKAAEKAHARVRTRHAHHS